MASKSASLAGSSWSPTLTLTIGCATPAIVASRITRSYTRPRSQFPFQNARDRPRIVARRRGDRGDKFGQPLKRTYHRPMPKSNQGFAFVICQIGEDDSPVRKRGDDYPHYIVEP